MKDKEKQIEEMFNYLRECSNNAWAKGFDYAEIDNEKLREFLTLFSEDSVVIPKDEYQFCQAIKNFYVSYEQYLNFMHVCNEAKIDCIERKTAKKILNEVSKHYGGAWLVELYKKYGVEAGGDNE